MQPKNFTQKLLRQRRFLSSLIPLLALFVGLGASQSALAQTTFTDNSVNINVRGTSGDYNTQSGTIGGTNFTERDFGTFDLSVPTDVFVLNGATLTITEGAGDNFNRGELLVRVFPGSLAHNIGAIIFTRISLVAGATVAGSRTYTLSNAGRDLLASVTSPAGAAPKTPTARWTEHRRHARPRCPVET